jgi:hypothetical protein
MKGEAKFRPLCRTMGLFVLMVALVGCGETTVTSNADSSNSTASSSSSSNSANASVIALSSNEYIAAASTSVAVTIYRVGSSTGSASVSFTTVDGSASAGVDYVKAAGSVAWEHGDSSAKTISVLVRSTANGKQFSFVLTDISGAASFGNPASATIAVGAQSSPTGALSAVKLSWSAPTQNSNGTALNNLAGFTIYYGSSASALTSHVTISTSGILDYVITDLSSGTWYFQVVAINASGVQSDPSTTVGTTI